MFKNCAVFSSTNITNDRQVRKLLLYMAGGFNCFNMQFQTDLQTGYFAKISNLLLKSETIHLDCSQDFKEPIPATIQL